jgi:hypothetical protein
MFICQASDYLIPGRELVDPSVSKWLTDREAVLRDDRTSGGGGAHEKGPLFGAGL